MPKQSKSSPDTLEQIVEEAIEREKEINLQHPERHGYGMIEGEANDLIRRIERLEFNQLRAQGAKVKHREDRIRVIGSDKLYTHSPEDIVINNLDREQIANAEKKVLDKLSKRSLDFYLLKERGLKFTDIGKLYKIHRSTVSRSVKKTIETIKEGLEHIKSGGENYIFK